MRHLTRPLLALISGLATLALPADGALAQAPANVRAVRAIQVPRDAGQIHPPVVSAVAVSPDGALVAAAGDDHQVRLWRVADSEDGAPRVLRGHRDWVRSLAFSPAGDTLVSAGEDRQIILWSMPSGQRLRALPAQAEAIYGLDYSSDGTRLATIGFSNRVRLLNNVGQMLNQLQTPCTDMRAVAFSPDGRLLAAAGRNGELALWRLPEGTEALPKFKASPRRIRAVAFSPDGARVATGGEGLNVRVWDTRTGKELAAFSSRPGKSLDLAFCGPDTLAAASTHNVIRVWDLTSGVESLNLVGHEGSVASIAYDPNSRRLISGSFDTTIRFWDLQSQDNTAGLGGATR